MGQQQLLLVILVTIIVGIATVVAINTFGSAAANANEDAIRNDIASIGASAQGYYMKPKQLGGGGQSFNNITFNDIGFGAPADSIAASGVETGNSNAHYTLAIQNGGDSLQVTANPTSKGNSDIVAKIGADNINFQ